LKAGQKLKRGRNATVGDHIEEYHDGKEGNGRPGGFVVVPRGGIIRKRKTSMKGEDILGGGNEKEKTGKRK